MGISIWQILIVAILIVVIFGAGRLPRVMEDLAKGIKSFKKGLADDDATPTQKLESKDADKQE